MIRFFRTQIFLCTFSSLFLLTGCSNKPLTFARDLNEILKPLGSSITLVKAHGDQDSSYCVVRQNDTDKYIAFDLDSWKTWDNRGGGIIIKWESVEHFIKNADSDDIITDLVPAGERSYYSRSFNMVFEETNYSKKDLEKYGAQLESLKIGLTAENITSRFGLSEERGIVVAKLYNDWNAINKKRAITILDLNEFSRQLTGISYEKIRSSYVESIQGNKTALKIVYDKAAEINRITPENISKIINEMFNYF
ncbi:MAG: hypothetical protein HQK51_03805 [Oligoflexia bacterium]|nr:hypothetical protein [Oligoflexia bacterium]